MEVTTECARIVETEQRKIAATRDAGHVARGVDLTATLT